ncbi:MAG: alkaline phosphatase PafA [Arcticibacter sp.]
MNLRYVLQAAAILLALNASAQKKSASQPASRPKLVVGIVIDQMRWDYLYRYQDRYTDGGFKRLLSEGFTAENTNIDYVPTVTAIGHSSIYTGSVPSIHGIAGNDFIIQATGKSMYCTEDTTAKTVGSPSSAGEMSPRNLLSTTMTDELKLATNFRSKVIGIAIKDRGGILPAGHSADAAYWFDDESGNWITSTFYMNELPKWVQDFNNKKLPKKYLDQNWTTLFPIDTYVQSEKDDSRFEAKFSGTAAPVFPYQTSTMYGKDFGIIRTTPYGNTITLDMAKAAIDNEKMGQRDITDFLAVSLSSTDYIGHRFGPNSIEAEDTYLRLDRELSAFFSYLDSKVGKGSYTVFISADHGAAHNPNFLTSHNIPAGLFPTSTVTKELNASLAQEFKQEKLVISLSNYQVSLNNALIQKNNLDEAAIKKACIRLLKKREDVAYAVDMEEVQQASIPQELKTKIINGYNRERSGVVQIVLKPGYFSGSSTGTTHGTWNPYDTHIPFVLMGWGVRHGSTSRPTGMTDIAPTISALLRIQAPNGNIGKPVTEALLNEVH